MRPSAYDEVTAKDALVEDRDQVKVVFAGGNVFHLHVEGMGEDEHETVRGSNKAWERAEAIRLQLNPAYTPPEPDTGETTPAAPPAGDVESAGAVGPAAKPEPPTAPAAGGGKEPDAVRKVRYGAVEGRQSMVPVSVVLDILADHAGRVALLQGSDEARRLARRVRATDGRCAPIFLTKENIDDPKEMPQLYSGLHTLAAAINLDMDKVPVVILPSGRVREVQGMISSMMRANLSNDSDAEGDELMYRAYND